MKILKIFEGILVLFQIGVLIYIFKLIILCSNLGIASFGIVAILMAGFMGLLIFVSIRNFIFG